MLSPSSVHSGSCILIGLKQLFFRHSMPLTHSRDCRRVWEQITRSPLCNFSSFHQATMFLALLFLQQCHLGIFAQPNFLNRLQLLQLYELALVVTHMTRGTRINNPVSFRDCDECLRRNKNFSITFLFL